MFAGSQSPNATRWLVRKQAEPAQGPGFDCIGFSPACSGAKVAAPQRPVGGELARRAVPCEPAAFDDDVPIGKVDQSVHVFVDNEDSLAGPPQLVEAAPDLLADQRRKPLGRLVQDQ